MGKKKIGEKEISKWQEQKVEEGHVNDTKGKTTTMLTLLNTDEPPLNSQAPIIACHEVGVTWPLAHELVIGHTIKGEGEGIPNAHDDLEAAVLHALWNFWNCYEGEHKKGKHKEGRSTYG